MGEGSGPFWAARERDYCAEAKERDASFESEDVTDEHPLLGGASATHTETSAPVTATSNPLNDDDSDDDEADPLGASKSPDDIVDPLSQVIAAETAAASAGAASHFDDSFEPWSMKRQGILAKYTTNQRLSILGLDDGEGKAKVVTQASSVTDKVKNRLEQLDDMSSGGQQQLLDLGQQEYVDRIQELNDELTRAWKSEQRVKALKIAIQCAKLLADTRVVQFYPSKFVLITDILDNFGNLVSERIEEKSMGPGKRLPPDYTPDMIPPFAKEVARNWFFKIASIRELIPRLYVETALLKCYSFLTSGEYEAALMRLTSMMRGIGDPLVAIYARCYICRVGVIVASSVKSHLMPNFNDFMSTYPQLTTPAVRGQMEKERINFSTYVNLYVPALDWILQCVGYKASEEVMDHILEQCKKHNVALLINSVMAAFPPKYISARAVTFCEMIRNSAEEGLPKHHLYRSLGMNVSFAAPPEEDRKSILNDVWKIVTELDDPGEYIACAEVWIEYPVKNFGKKEINAMLKDCLEHMTKDKAYERYIPQLQAMLFRMVSNMQDLSIIFAMDKFLPFIDLFQQDSVRVEVCKSVMESFVRHQKETINDPVAVHALMYIGRYLHDSVSPMTVVDERKQITELIVGFLSKIAFGRDFEQTLDFLVNARGSFTNLDPVMRHLVIRVNWLAMRTLALMKGSHNRKTSTFVRSCFAYAFITVPSIESHVDRLQLYLLSAQCAVQNGCLSQAEAMIKQAIKLIPEVPEKIDTVEGPGVDADPFLGDYVAQLINTLVTVPDNPEQGPMYLMKSVVQALAERTYPDDSDVKSLALVRCIAALAATTQREYLFRLPHITLNDELYGNAAKFIEAVADVVEVIKGQLLEDLQGLNMAQSRQVAVASAMFDVIATHGDVSKPAVARLLTNLWGLIERAGGSSKVKAKTAALVGALVDRGIPGAQELHAKLY